MPLNQTTAIGNGARKRTRQRRVLLVVNPRARRGTGPIAAARGVLEQAQMTVTEAVPGEGESIADIIRRNARNSDLVVVGGGDGTLNAAAPALVETSLPFGVIPLGTANDFARTIGIPTDPRKAAELIAAGNLKWIDLGEVNGKLFFNVASIGFSAELAHELTVEAKRRWGTLGYAIVATRILTRSRLFTAFVDHDGTSERIRTMQVSVGNGRHYGGGMTVQETATPDDGKLDFYSLEVDHWWRLLALLPSLRKGTHGSWDDVRAFRTTEVTVHTVKRRPVNTDGELSTHTPAHFRIRPKALRVLAPRN